jgi:HD-GYP domain-containing protein (c-di-GMP phosphodiesterase class II)
MTMPKDSKLDFIRKAVRDRMSKNAAFQRYHLNRYAEIGMALSGEEDTARLLEMIVYEAREITNADAGTLYMINEESTHLDFVILQNDTMRTFLGGLAGVTIAMPPVPLYVDGEENHINVSSHVALTGEIVNIPDVYESEAFDFSGTRTYDQSTGYRSKSMLVIPMRDHQNEIIGVLQLLNAVDDTTHTTIDFNEDYVPLVASLASQAAVTLTKTRLIDNLKELFDAFIRSIAGAIEEKSRYTGGHIARVSKLATMIAEQINRTEHGRFKDVSFSEQELEELRLAAWLHDVGKIITPEYVVDKSSKLQTIHDRIAEVDLRLLYIQKSSEARYLQQKLERSLRGQTDFADLDAAWDREWETIQQEREFLQACNKPTFEFTREREARLEQIAAKTYMHDGEERDYLSQDELRNLRIPKGTLTEEERQIIRNHATVTFKMLSSLPFPKDLKRVPDFAAQHHEKLDGSGYPFGLTAPLLSLQARIMVVADIFEALTARDRPYKDPTSLSQAIAILGDLKARGHIDPDVHDVLVESGLISTYACQELEPQQVDIPLNTQCFLHKQDPLSNRLMHLLDTPPEVVAGQGSKRVLFVDDSVNHRMLIRYYLHGSSYTLDLAGSALEALELLIKRDHHAVLVDLDMPRMDGFALGSSIRQWERRHKLPQRMLTAIAAPYQVADAKRMDQAGFSHTLRRPFGKRTILEFLESFC